MKKCGFTTVNEAASGDLRVREGVQTAVEVRRIVRSADRRHPHHVFHPAKPRRPERIRRLDRRTRPGWRQQPRDIDALERPLDGAEERQIAGTQLDALGRKVLGLGRVATRPIKRWPEPCRDRITAEVTLPVAPVRRIVDMPYTIAPRSGLHNTVRLLLKRWAHRPRARRMRLVQASLQGTL